MCKTCYRYLAGVEIAISKCFFKCMVYTNYDEKSDTQTSQTACMKEGLNCEYPLTNV